MKKVVLLISIVLVSAAASSAQTAGKSEQAAGGGNRPRASKASPSGRKGRAPAVLRLGPSTTYLKNGLRADEVLRLLGAPASSTERREGEALLATLTFARGEGRVLVAEFVNGVLVESHTQPGESVARQE